MDLQPAYWFHRLIHFVVDLVVANLIMILVLTSIVEIDTKFELDLTWLRSITTSPILITLPLWYFGYYLLCEKFWGKTVGKIYTGAKVISKNGAPPTWLQIFSRSLARSLFFAIELLSFLRKRPVGWHDKFSDTIVVIEENHPYK